MSIVHVINAHIAAIVLEVLQLICYCQITADAMVHVATEGVLGNVVVADGLIKEKVLTLLYHLGRVACYVILAEHLLDFRAG